MKPRKPIILVVEPEPSARKMISAHLAAAGYEVLTAADDADAMQVFNEALPNLVILEFDTPTCDGLQICRGIRDVSEVPIIVLSSRTKESDKITALNLGADAYLTKPLGMGELLARMRAILRRSVLDLDTGNGKYDFEDFSVDLAARRVMRQGTEVKLTPTEFALLVLFVHNAGKVLTHQHILEALWGDAHREDREYLRAYVYNLRRKVELNAKSPRHILSVLGVGYQFEPAQAANPVRSSN